MFDHINLKKHSSESLSTMRSEVQSFFDEMLSLERMSFLRFIIASCLSALLCCVGLNFENEWIVYSSLILSPFTNSFILFVLGIYSRDNAIALSSFYNMVLGSISVVLFGIIYFKLTPFAYDLKFLFEFSSLNLSNYIFVLIVAFGFGFYSKSIRLLVVWSLSIMMKWIVLLCFASYLFTIKDWNSMIQVIIQYKLIFIMLFIGMFFSLTLWNFHRKEFSSRLQNMIISALLVVSLAFGLYFGSSEFYRLTTEHNVRQYLYGELASKTFVINTYTINKNLKEICIYYSGLRPVGSQDEELKDKYHIQSYHIVYQEVK